MRLNLPFLLRISYSSAPNVVYTREQFFAYLYTSVYPSRSLLFSYVAQSMTVLQRWLPCFQHNTYITDFLRLN